LQNGNVGRSDQQTAGEGKKLDLQSSQPGREAYPHQSGPTSNLAYMMSVFPAPKGILQKIRAIQRDFLWRGAENKKKWALVAWEKVFRPKGKGGLGLQDPQVTNEAYGEKLWWRWVKDKSVPWENLWKAKYAPNINDQDQILLMGTREGSTIWNLAWCNKN
jgi:hypothetical protein